MLCVVQQITWFEIVGRYFQKPVRLDFQHITHEFLACENKLVEENPFRTDFKKRRRRMDIHSVRIFESAVASTLLKSGCVVEEPRT